MRARLGLIAATMFLGLAGSPGCLFPYCARSVTSLPSFDLNCDPREVHAFCAELSITETKEDGIKERWEMHAVPLNDVGPRGMTPGQSKVSYDYGLYALSPASANGPLAPTTHALSLRLYRPGFETVVLNGDEPAQPVVWKPAADLAAQEKAIDEIFGTVPIAPKSSHEPTRVRELYPGSKSQAHHDALMFGVAEYQRLAALVNPKWPEQKGNQDRLRGKATQLAVRAATGVKPKTH
jgi:hypothetical protein